MSVYGNDLLLQYWVQQQSKPDPLTYPLCFTAVENDSTVKLNKRGSPADISLEYSYDNNTWTAYTIGDTITLNTRGAKVFFRGTNSTFSSSTSNYYQFYCGNGGVAVSGNISSLHDTSLTSLTVPANYFFQYLFQGSTNKIVSAKELVLPYTTLKSNCFNSMFANNASLVAMPRIDAVSIVQHCFANLFYNCAGLAGEVHLKFKFNGLQACYSMFSGCTGITSAKLDATSFSSSNAAYNLFSGCSRLSRIEVNITAWQNCPNWVNGVASSGMFVCPADLPDERGTNRIPSNWTIVRK